MKVAIHINASLHHYKDCFNKRFAKLLAERCPQHEFVFILDDKKCRPEALPFNVKLIQSGPAITNRLMAKYWYDVRLPKLLKREETDLLITAGDIFSRNTGIHQVCLLHAAENLKPGFQKFCQRRQKESDDSRLHPVLISDRAIPGFAKIVTSHLRQSSGFSEKLQEILQHSGNNQVAEEAGYFIFLSNGEKDPDLITVMKAFSIFKKWQRSSMKLVIVTDEGRRPIIENLSSYKFREDVILPDLNSEGGLSQWINGAFAGISFGGKGEQDPLWQFLTRGIPSITLFSTIKKLFWEDAVLYSLTDEKEISDRMISLYKDDRLRDELGKRGLTLARQHDTETFCKELESKFYSIIV